MDSLLVVCAAFGVGVMIGAFIPLARRLHARLPWVDEHGYSSVETPIGRFHVTQSNGWWRPWHNRVVPVETFREVREREKAKAQVQAVCDNRMQEMGGGKGV